MKGLSLVLMTGLMAMGTPSMAQVIIPVPTVEGDGTIAPLTPTPEPQTISPAVPVNIPPDSGTNNSLYFLTRAKNLARQAGINENGGLLLYRPEQSMYGPALESPFTRNSDGSVTFTFRGGAPGTPLNQKETEVRVDNNVQVTVLYNGTPRGSIGGASSEADEVALAALDEDTFIARARNLARQAGISANGGLDVYRPESAMFGPTSGAPFVKNADGSVTFTFKGGSPLSQVPTQETSVTVTQEGQVTVNYNRPL